MTAENPRTDATPPHWLSYLTEPHRAMAEYVGFASGRRFLALQHAGGGDGRHVLVLPGLLADDRSTRALRGVLRDAGYQPHGWSLGTNVGPTRGIVAGIQGRVDDLAARSDRPVSVIGWSLGGLLAREAAKLQPGKIDRVITLGSPLNMSHRGQSRASAAYEMFASRHLPDYAFDAWIASRVDGITQPITSVYTRGDGIVHWQSCLVEPGPRSENVEVFGSHCGLGMNLAAAHVVLDRLAVPIDDWTPFTPERSYRALFPGRLAASA